MMRSKKGFQMSINMIVVLVLGIVILGAGFSIFSSAASKVNNLREDVDDQTKMRINSLLDDGSMIVIPFTKKDGVRGEYVDFDLGINNELGAPHSFSVLVTYAGSSAYPPGGDTPDPFFPLTNMENIKNFAQLCPDTRVCGFNWVLRFDNYYVDKDIFIANNGVDYVPIRIEIPKKDVKKGQYTFNVDVCYNMSSEFEKSTCELEGGRIENRYGSRQILYVTV